MTKPQIITINRQLGSGGTCLGRWLAWQLNWPYLDRQILESATKDLGADLWTLEGRDERLQSIWERLLQGFAVGSPDAPCLLPLPRLIPDQVLIAAERKVIELVAAKGPCVIVGHGAFHYLRKRPDLLSLFVHAPLEFRLERVMRIFGISDRGKALEQIWRHDRNREEYVHSISGLCWREATTYHLSLNMGILGQEKVKALLRVLTGLSAALESSDDVMDDLEP